MNIAIKRAKEVIESFQTEDLREICEQLEIMIIEFDLPDTVEGFFQNFAGKMIIYVNENIDFMRKKFVIGHELGHILLHKEVNSMFMKENSFFNIEKCEKEANMFSTYFLIDKYEYDVEFASKFFELEIEKLQTILADKNNI